MQSDEVAGAIVRESVFQSEIIAKYCTGIEQRIAEAHSIDAARELVANSCQSLQQECLSEIIKTSLENYIRGLMKRYWGVR